MIFCEILESVFFLFEVAVVCVAAGIWEPPQVSRWQRVREKTIKSRVMRLYNRARIVARVEYACTRVHQRRRWAQIKVKNVIDL